MGVALRKSSMVADLTDLQWQPLTSQEQRLIVGSWKTLGIDYQKLGARFVYRILSTRPDLKKYFGLVNVEDQNLYDNDKFLSHAKNFGEFLNTIVANLNEDYALNYMRQVGIRHIYYLQPEITVDTWEHFGTCMHDVMAEQSPKKYEKTLDIAWKKVCQALVAEMKTAFYEREARERGVNLDGTKISDFGVLQVEEMDFCPIPKNIK